MSLKVKISFERFSHGQDDVALVYTRIFAYRKKNKQFNMKPILFNYFQVTKNVLIDERIITVCVKNVENSLSIQLELQIKIA